MPTPMWREHTPGRTGNDLLDRFPEEDFARLSPSLAVVSLVLRDLLDEADRPIRDVYFPTTAMISMIVVMEDGNEVETGLVGSEGLVGLSVALGLDSGLQRSICQSRGDAWRLPAPVFREVLERSRPLNSLIMRYAAVTLRQTAQVVACNALHPVAERLCRWLLMSHDRVGRDKFVMTQEFMGEMLGVRRQSVAVVAGTLQAAGLIRYSRGMIEVLDRAGLEAASCECYRLIRVLNERLLP